MRNGDGGGVDMALDAAMYFVMSHYHIGPSELSKITSKGFTQMFTWAVATEQIKAEQMEEAVGDIKGSVPNAGGNETHKISSTSMNKMPFSE